MNQLSRWLMPAAVAGVVLMATEAQAQVPGAPGSGTIVGPGTSPLPPTGNLMPSWYNPQQGFYGPGYGLGQYGYGTNYDPYGGYLRGAADVYMGQATFVKAREEAKILREKANQEKLATRRMMFEQWLDEQRRMPTPEQIRQQQVQQEILRSLNGPQTTEVASGAPMNYLLGPLSELIDRDRSGTKPVALDREQVRRLNVTKGDGFGNIGLLRNEGKLTFPVALTTLAPADETKALLRDLETFSRMAYEQAAAGGPVDGNVVKQLDDLARRLSDRLTRNINDIDFTDYAEGRRFLRGLNDAIALLRQPDASRWVSGQLSAQGTTVQDLVRNMASKGLRFAPANPGDEPAYSAVHQAMVNLYNTLKATSSVSTTAPPQPAAGK